MADRSTNKSSAEEFPEGFSLHISRLTSPAGSHATEVYGRARAEWPLKTDAEQADREGFVHIHEEMGWIRVQYMPFNQPLPRSHHDSCIYYAYTRDPVFEASPDQLDAILPEYIHVPDSYTEFDSNEHDTFFTIWHGTLPHKMPRDDSGERGYNLTKLFTGIDPISDEAWDTVEEYDALCEAVEAGYEDEQTVRDIVGDDFFEASDSDERYYLID